MSEVRSRKDPIDDYATQMLGHDINLTFVVYYYTQPCGHTV